MGEWNFNRTQCIKALMKLGFCWANKRKKAKHDKYKQAKKGGRFIMVPRHNELHCQKAIVRELKIIGGEEMVKEFKSYL